MLRASIRSCSVSHIRARRNEDPRGTQKRSSFDEIIAEHEPARALLPFNGGIRGAYTVQSLSSIYGQAWPESLCGVQLGTGPRERIADGLKEESEEAISPVYGRYSPFRVAPPPRSISALYSLVSEELKACRSISSTF